MIESTSKSSEERIVLTESKWIALAKAACGDAGIETKQIETITTWEQTFSDNDLLRHNAVFRVNDRYILKLYGTDATRHSQVELNMLKALVDVVPSPRVVSNGELNNGRPYLIMTEVKGQTLQDAWPSLSGPELLNIAHQIGIITANLHSCRVDELAKVESYVGGRLQIIAEEQKRRIAEILAMADLAPWYRTELLEYTQTEALKVANYPAVLTHADLSHAHIYIHTTRNKSIVSGFIDWAEATVGPAEWDLAFHWFWTFSRNKEAMKACLDAYYAGKERPEDLARRCFSAHYFTFSMTEVWNYFRDYSDNRNSILASMMINLFPPEIFGLSRYRHSHD